MSVKAKKSKKQPDAADKFNELESSEKQKGLTLFDHIKHIQKVQDPEYYNNLSDLDKKSFNHFMILRGLSMNPHLVDDIATLFRYFDTIPSPQFYQLLISVIPIENSRTYYPWIKSSKNKYSDAIIDLIVRKFEVSQTHAIEYLNIFTQTESGMTELFNICKGFALTDKEVEKLITDDK